MGKIAQRILTVYSGIVYNKNRYEKYSKKNHFTQICSLLKENAEIGLKAGRRHRNEI